MFLSRVSDFFKFSPDLYLLDDPTSSLDVNVSEKIFETLKASRWKNKTFFIASNKLLILDYVDKVAFVSKGRLVFFDTVDKFRTTEHFSELHYKGPKVNIFPL
jgi:ABC-type multidrug transport system ATPase subunit